uniref:Uncharacterized protein n=1 Tax=Oryza punctata TaxID=4537 RepID=A0A0E0MBK8_ORYPU
MTLITGSKYELGRQPANTKLSSNKAVGRVRVCGGNVNWRAFRLDTGNYKKWYLTHFGVDIGRKKKAPAAKKDAEEYDELLEGFMIVVKLKYNEKMLIQDFK